MKEMGISSEKIEYLPHGYNSEEMFFSEDENIKIREALKIEPDEIVISYIGKFDFDKRPDLIFEIVNKMKLDKTLFSNVRFLFIGSYTEDYEKYFIKRFNEFYFKTKCIFLENQKFEDLYKFYSATDIAIWPKECTLSSIHAQVCHVNVIMEAQKSNVERVFNTKNLYAVNDLDDAAKILKKNILTKELNTDFLSQTISLKKREYHFQIDKIENEWREKRA